MLHQYICHRGGIATKNSTRGGKDQYIVCKNPDCERARTANGYCMKHGGQRYESQVCKNPDCERPRTDNGYCMEH